MTFGQNLNKQSMDQPDMLTNSARDQLNKEKSDFTLSPFAPENMVPRDGFGRPVPSQSASFPHSVRLTNYLPLIFTPAYILYYL